MVVDSNQERLTNQVASPIRLPHCAPLENLMTVVRIAPRRVAIAAVATAAVLVAVLAGSSGISTDTELAGAKATQGASWR